MAIRQDLMAFIQRKLGVIDCYLTQSSPLEQAFGMVELDTIMFYTDFVKEFGLEVPPDWDISNNVSPAILYNWRHYLKQLFSKSYRQKTVYRDLTIGELEQMIELKRWHVV